jgi:hypothetical protein
LPGSNARQPDRSWRQPLGAARYIPAVSGEFDDPASEGSPGATATPGSDGQYVSTDVPQRGHGRGGAPRLAAPGPERRSGGVRWTAFVVAAVVVLGVALLGVNWYRSHNSSDAPTSALPTNPGPVIMDMQGLQAVKAFAGHSVYWAGPQGLTQWEVTLAGRNIYIRYLPKGEKAGSSTPYLTVGTYEKKGAYAGLEAAAKVAGAKSERLAGGALVVQPAGKATSTYFGFSGAELLMEVYDPAPGRAYELIGSGIVQPIPAA